MPPRIAALMLGLLSLSSLVLNPIVGWLGDNMSKQRLSSVAMIAGALSLVALLNHSGNLWQVYVFVILLAGVGDCESAGMGHHGRLLRASQLRDAKRLATPAGPVDVDEARRCGWDSYTTIRAAITGRCCRWR